MSVTGLLSGSVKRFTGMTHSGRDNRKLLCYVSAGLVALFFLLYFLVSRASTWWMIPLHAKDIPYSYCPVTQRILRSKGVYGLSGRLLKLGISKNELGQCYPWLIYSQRPKKKSPGRIAVNIWIWSMSCKFIENTQTQNVLLENKNINLWDEDGTSTGIDLHPLLAELAELCRVTHRSV